MGANQQNSDIREHLDEINLFDLVRVLLLRKKIIFGVMFAVVLIGIFYAFSQKRVYQVETVLLPPSLEDIQQLNVVDVSKLSQGDVFSKFISNVNSRKLRETFFNDFKLVETLSKK